MTLDEKKIAATELNIEIMQAQARLKEKVEAYNKLINDIITDKNNG